MQEYHPPYDVIEGGACTHGTSRNEHMAQQEAAMYSVAMAPKGSLPQAAQIK